jgi:hypothetical protein
MKSNFIFILILLILFFTSCKNDVVEFSCDPILNSYISSHKDMLNQITVTELASSDLVFQQAVFRSFDAAKKREIWLEKIQFLMESQNYNEDEYIHLSKLKNHIVENYFTEESIKLFVNERSLFASNWIEYAKNNLGWSNKDIAFIVYRLYTNPIQFEAELNTIISISKEVVTDSEGGCNCNTSSDFCSGSICNSDNCSISSGCGWVWSESCNGICR